MITALCMLLMSSMIGGFGGPDSVMGYFGFIMCCLPFVWDMLISMRHAYGNMTSDRPQTATVQELTPANEENFLSMNEQESTESMYEPSERIMPDVVQRITPLNNLLTSNWKENAYDQRNSTVK